MQGGINNKRDVWSMQEVGGGVHGDPAAKPMLLTSLDLLGWMVLYVML